MAMLAERECRSPRGANRAGGARGDAGVGVGVGKSRYPEGGGGEAAWELPQILLAALA